MSVNRTKLPDSITNPRLRAIYEAALDELDLIGAEMKNALVYLVSDTHKLPIPDVLPVLAKDLNVHGLEYLNAENSDNQAGEDVYTKRREVVENSFRLHKRKGTAGIIRAVSQMTGRNDIDVKEWFDFDGHPYTFKVTVQLPLSQYECDVIFGLIKQYKRFVCRELNEYVTQKYGWMPVSGLMVGRYVDFGVQLVPGFVSINSIESGETVRIGTNLTISGVAGFDDGATVSLYRGEVLIGTATVSGNAFSYTWRAAGASGSDVIRAVCEEAEDSVSVEFVVVIVVNEPVENQAVTVGTAFDVSVQSVAEGNVSVYIGNTLIAAIPIVDGEATGTATIPDSLAGVGSAFIVDGGGETPAGSSESLALIFVDENGNATVTVIASLPKNFGIGDAVGSNRFHADYENGNQEFGFDATGNNGSVADNEAEYGCDMGTAQGEVIVTEE